MSIPRFEELTRDDLRKAAPAATVVVPVGSTEQHGPHLPVGTDFLVVSAIAERATTRAAGEIPLVLAPGIPFGFAHHHLPFGGTVSIGLETYADLLTEVGRSLVASGFRRIVFLNGHGGNDAPIRTVGDRLVFGHGLDAHVAATSYWTCAADELADLELDVGPVPGHAGGFETSCLLALRPDLVRTDRFPEPEDQLQPLASAGVRGVPVRRPDVWQRSDGRTDDSRRASAEVGERVLTAVSDAVGRFLVEFHKSVD